MRFSLRVLWTLLAAFAAAELCIALHTPLPWVIGPLLGTAAVSMAGLPTASAVPLRNAAQWTIGTTMGLYFTPQVSGLIAGLWWAILLAIVWALGAGTVFGAWLNRVHAARMGTLPPGMLRATTFFAGTVGGAAEMTLLAERSGARTDLVASSHSLRVLIVTLLVPFALQWSGVHGLDALPPAVREVRPAGLLLLGVLTGAGAWLIVRLKRPNPWFLGALLASMALTMSGTVLSAVPQPLSNAAQLVLAVSLGVRFSRGFLLTAPRWLASVALGTLGLVLVCAAFGVALAWLTKLHWGTMVLGTSPGGAAEMSITARAMHLGVPVVTAFQVCRLAAVLILVEPLYRWLYALPPRP